MKIIDLKQGSIEWHRMRQGKVTGTSLKSAIGTKKTQETLMYRLISERMTEPQIDDIRSNSVARGQEMEPIARKIVSKTTGIDFIEVGMLVSDEINNFAYSPDGVAKKENGNIYGGLEIKCPDSKKHIEYCLKDELPKEYEDQVKAPFLISNDIKWWFFASYDDRNYEKPLFLKPVYRSYFKSLEEDRKKLSEFLELVDKKHEGMTF